MRHDPLLEGKVGIFDQVGERKTNLLQGLFLNRQLSDAQVLAKIMDVCQREDIEYTDDGLEAVVFTAQGDMRQGTTLQL